mmetsp:Transcript_34994/g.64811  ORF Transcript_34994/g.64811 Transcript_34994/m.64811 type:complete len:220 (+) Transcript_34994:675-1334(+)
MVNLLIEAAPLSTTFGFLFVSWIASQILAVYSLLSMACSTVSTPSTSCACLTSLLVPASSPVAPSTFKATRATMNFFLSPTIMMLEMAGCNFLTLASIGTGATFSPPAPMMSSLYRPVILIIPFSSMQPLSPEWSHPFLSMADMFFFFAHSEPPSSLKSGFARYPIMMWRPRKQSSPCSSSVALNRSFALLTSTYSPSLPSFRILNSIPGIGYPHEPHS